MKLYYMSKVKYTNFSIFIFKEVLFFYFLKKFLSFFILKKFYFLFLKEVFIFLKRILLGIYLIFGLKLGFKVPYLPFFTDS